MSLCRVDSDIINPFQLTMELSTKILSQISDAAQVTRLTRLLAQIRRDINRKRTCMLQGTVLGTGTISNDEFQFFFC